MAHWKSEQLEQLVQARHEPRQMFEHAVVLAQALGMEFVGLSLHLRCAMRPADVYLYNNYPAAWNALYEQEKLNRIDPVIAKSHGSTLPLLWDNALYQEVPHLREAACAHGLTHGWTQSVHDLRHNESQLSVCRQRKAVSTTELYAKSAQIMWLCHTLHAALSEHHLPKSALHLSERELEVLKWSAAGKTAADVGTILTLSTSTVNFHIRSVITKTNAANKAGAIAIAALHGLL
jgi:LuxR family transcriptional regulator